jgi:sodium transport system ATP-binding protein
MIAAENLHKRLGDHIAVRDVSFMARDGEITGLLGSNGAGKTTTLRIIAGLLHADRGEVRINGGPGNLGALLDHTGLYARLTVRENIAYFGRLRAVPVLERRVEDMLTRLGLQTLAERPAGRLSMGERMKVALGRALIHEPHNLLLDEPTNGLDIPAVRQFRDALRRMRETGHCILFSSHVIDDIRALCNRIVIIANGSVVAEGTPEELCDEAGCQSIEDAYLRLTGTREVMAC